MGLLLKDNQFGPTIKMLIEQAKKTIAISTFKLEKKDKTATDPTNAILNAMIAKKRNGIKVRCLFNWHTNQKLVPRTNIVAGRYLKTAGVEVRHLKYNRCCHAKILIIDNERAVVGSHNLSVKSLTSNFEISYLLADIESVSALSSIYDKSWNDAEAL